MGGKPCIRGMRITVGTITGLLSAGKTNEKILQLYPDLEQEDIFAALAYATWLPTTAIPKEHHRKGGQKEHEGRTLNGRWPYRSTQRRDAKFCVSTHPTDYRAISSGMVFCIELVWYISKMVDSYNQSSKKV